MTTQEICSVTELIELVAARTAEPGTEFWYRGHRRSDWSLLPSVFRTKALKRSESAMMARFQQEAALSGLPYNFDDWGWMTFAQHYGLPTRLLDWSQSPLIAAFFACEEETEPGGETVGEFFMLDPKALNKEAGSNDGGHPALLRSTDTLLGNYLPDGKASLRPRAVLAPLVFERIRWQTGTFTICQPPDPEELEPLRTSIAVQSFLIPPEAKRTFRLELESLGLNEASIYKDLDRIAARIVRNSTR